MEIKKRYTANEVLDSLNLNTKKKKNGLPMTIIVLRTVLFRAKRLSVL